MVAKHIIHLAMAFLSLAISAGAQGDWISLFDGKTLSGWQQFNGTAKYWIEDGAIVGQTREGSPNSFLCSRAWFDDFELTFEVMVNPRLNSGVQIRSRLKQDPGDYGRVFGPQVEIEGGKAQAGYLYGEATGRGWLSPEPQSPDPEVNSHSHFKDNAWNRYRIVARGPRIQTYINGELIADLADEDIFETHPSGFIGLQVHSVPKGTGPYEVRWRDIRIRPLD